MHVLHVLQLYIYAYDVAHFLSTEMQACMLALYVGCVNKAASFVGSIHELKRYGGHSQHERVAST